MPLGSISGRPVSEPYLPKLQGMQIVEGQVLDRKPAALNEADGPAVSAFT
jgi:hypothetical protein